MKLLIKIILYIAIYLFCNHINAQQDTISQEQIDSLFNTVFNQLKTDTLSCTNDKEWSNVYFKKQFKKMQYALDSNLMYDYQIDRIFVYLLTYMSGIGCTDIGYGGFCYYDQKKLDQWKNWYKKNKEKITKRLIIKGYSIIKDGNAKEKQSLYIKEE